MLISDVINKLYKTEMEDTDYKTKIEENINTNINGLWRYIKN